MGLLDDNQVNDPDVQDILNNPAVDPQTRGMAKHVLSGEQDIANAGFDPQLTQPRGSLFSDILDTLDAPRQGVAGIIDAAVRGDIFGTDAQTGESVGTGFMRGQEENTTSSDILARLGVTNPIVRGVAGFAGDVLTDPLTYLSFGTGNVAKVAGHALTEAGETLRDVGLGRIFNSGIVDPIEASTKLEDAFRSVSRYQDAAEGIKSGSESERAIEAFKLSEAQDAFSDVFSPHEIAGQDLFAKKTLKVGVTVPLLGHLTGGIENAATEVLTTEPGIVGKALRAAGDLWSPAHIGLGEFDISEPVAQAFNSINEYAKGITGSIADKLGALSDVPILGGGIKAAGAIAERAKAAYDATTTTLTKIFNQKAILGPTVNDLRLQNLRVKAGNKTYALQETMSVLGDAVKNPALQKDAYLDLDALAMSSLKERGGDPDVLEAINRIRTTQTALDGDKVMFSRLATAPDAAGITPEMNFRAGLAQYLANDAIPAERRALVGRTIGSMDKLAAVESEKGITYSALEYYLPHRYENIGQADSQFFKPGVPNPSFLQQRKYATIGEAFAQRGYVGDTDLASLVQFRHERGMNLVADRQYAQRLALEEGLPRDLVRNLYQEAVMNPGGPAEQALARYRINLKPFDADLYAEGRANQLYQDAAHKALSGDPEATRIVADGASSFAQKVREEMFAAGARPIDNALPDAFLGELGKEVTIPGGGSMFLPKPIADSYLESIAARDLLKSALGNSAFGKATLGAIDHTTSTFKKWFTVPFPAFWGHRFMGGNFQQAMQGIEAINPGIFARTKSVLAGESAIVTPAGFRIDRPTLERVIKQNGINFSTGDYIGTVQSFADSNIDALLASKNSLATNLTSGDPGTKIAALRQAQDKFEALFGAGFLRINHVVHRLEKGDAIADAVSASNKAFFDYRDMSPVEQSFFRRFYMFYGHMSKATKQTVGQLLTSPGNLTQQLHGVNALAEFFSDPNRAPTLEQHDMKLLGSVVSHEELTRNIGRSPVTGQPVLARAFAAPIDLTMRQFSFESPRNFSVGEILDTAGDSVRRTIQKQFAMANPVINAAAQYVSGKNLYFDKPLDTEFLRKLPDLTQAAKDLSGFAHTDIPITINDTVKSFLKAVPDGKGRLIADPSRFWLLNTMVPGMSRWTSTVGAFTNENVPTSSALLRTFAGVNLEDSDPTRSLLGSRQDEVDNFIKSHSVKQINKNQKDAEE